MTTLRSARSKVPELLLLVALGFSGCREEYRIGEKVLVKWRDEGPYPAFVLEKKSRRFRVHFDGYPDRCDEDVMVDAVTGRATDEVVPPNPPAGVYCVAPKQESNPAHADYKVGDKVRVTWRGSVYAAVITEVVARDRFVVHYEGHEAEWDETVPLERVVGKR